jgi:hypothetical protein
MHLPSTTYFRAAIFDGPRLSGV